MIRRSPFSHVTRYLSLAAFLLLTAYCLLPTVATAQTTNATLSGVVEDQKGAVVPGVKITVTNPATGLERTVVTDSSGAYIVPLLPPATYTVTAEQAGFATVKFPNITLNVNDQRSLRIELKVGSVGGEVEVRADESVISTSPAVATTIDRTFVGNLPLNGRSFQSLILLTPGVVLTPVNGNSPAGFSVNGQRGNANYFTVDGVSANTSVSTNSVGSQEMAGSVPGFTALGTTTNLVSIDALEEFKIQTSTYTAEYGRQPGGQIQLVTRSGANQFHGTAFDYVRNEIFDANDWFTNSRPLNAQQIAQGITKQPRAPLRQNDFGGTFSGPVILPRFGEGGKPYWKGNDRTFFFFSYEGLRLLLPTTINTLVPSLRLRRDAAATMKPLLNIFPLPTGPENTNAAGVPTGVAPFVGGYSSPSNIDATSIRIDHAASSKLTLFGRYSDTPSNSLSRSLSFLQGRVSRGRTVTLGSTYLVTPKLSNELRFNYSTTRARAAFTMDSFGGAVPIDQSVLLSGYNGPGNKFGRLFISFAGINVGPGLGDSIDSSQRQINLVDNVSLVKGSHQLKFGFDFRRLMDRYGPKAYEQEIFLNSETDVLSGTPSFVIIRARRGVRPVFDNYSFYGQDRWKPSSVLTLDLGLRWELNPAPRDAGGIKPVLVCGVEQLPTATLCPANTPFYKTIYTAFAPRVGVAYLVNQKSGRETVLRGGFGVYYDLGNGQATNAFDLFPFSALKFVGAPLLPLAPAEATPPVFPPVNLPLTNINVTSLNPNLRLPYTLQWNVAMEQSLGQHHTVTLSYVAAAGRNLLTTQNLNQPTSSGRPNPNFGSVFYTANGSSSDYRSLQIRYQRRLSRGLQGLVNYTWSQSIDEVSNEFATGVLDRGSSDFDVRHNFSAAATYNIPKLSVVTPVFRDWAVDLAFYAQSGQPFNLTVGSFIRPDGTQFEVRPDVVPDIPFWINDGAVAGGRRLNPAAFALPPRVSGLFTRQGTLGRNVIRLPGRHQLNMALGRKFPLSERWSLQLKAEAFNVLNHPLFGGHRNFFSPGVTNLGVPSSTLNKTLGGLNSLYQLGGSRSIQFSARLSF
jgi:carboxypeptidase family protein